MEKNGNKYSTLKQQIESLSMQYEAALKNGVEFSTLKEIKEKIKLLKQQLPDATNGNTADDFARS